MMNLKRKVLFYAPALRYFVAVAEHQSIRGASRELNVASSAVNRHLLKLERAFGVKFFDRVGRNLKLSEPGHILLRHAKRALADLDNAVASIEDISGLKRGHVSVATVESVADSLMPEMVRSFQKKYPGIEIEVQIGSAASVTERLAESECHLAINFTTGEDKGGVEICSFELPVGAIVRKGHPLASKKTCSIEECLAFPLALPSRTLSVGRIVHQLIERIASEQEFLQLPRVQSNSLRFVRNFVENDDYVAFQTHLGLKNEELLGKLVFVPLDDNAIKVDNLVLMRSALQELSLAPLEFAAHAQQCLEDNMSGAN
jgi:DNA-binding transcriptional LysR family regulator